MRSPDWFLASSSVLLVWPANIGCNYTVSFMCKPLLLETLVYTSVYYREYQTQTILLESFCDWFSPDISSSQTVLYSFHSIVIVVWPVNLCNCKNVLNDAAMVPWKVRGGVRFQKQFRVCPVLLVRLNKNILGLPGTITIITVFVSFTFITLVTHVC